MLITGQVATSERGMVKALEKPLVWLIECLTFSCMRNCNSCTPNQGPVAHNHRFLPAAHNRNSNRTMPQIRVAVRAP